MKVILFLISIHKNINQVFNNYNYHEVNDDFAFIWDACVEKTRV